MSSTLVVVVVNGYANVIGSRTLLRAMLGAVVLVLVCAGAAADFGVIGMIERFEDELSPVGASGSDGISEGG